MYIRIYVCIRICNAKQLWGPSIAGVIVCLCRAAKKTEGETRRFFFQFPRSYRTIIIGTEAAEPELFTIILLLSRTTIIQKCYAFTSRHIFIRYGWAQVESVNLTTASDTNN